MRYFALLFFVIGLMFFVFNITGNVILEDYVSSSLIGVVVLFSFLVAFLFMVKGKISLDAILVPCSNEEGLTRKRARRAVRAHKKYPDAMIVVSGGRTPELNPNYSSEAQIAYEVLKEAGIKSKNVKVETHSKDSIDNISSACRLNAIFNFLKTALLFKFSSGSGCGPPCLPRF